MKNYDFDVRPIADLVKNDIKKYFHNEVISLLRHKDYDVKIMDIAKAEEVCNEYLDDMEFGQLLKYYSDNNIRYTKSCYQDDVTNYYVENCIVKPTLAKYGELNKMYVKYVESEGDEFYDEISHLYYLIALEYNDEGDENGYDILDVIHNGTEHLLGVLDNEYGNK